MISSSHDHISSRILGKLHDIASFWKPWIDLKLVYMFPATFILFRVLLNATDCYEFLGEVKLPHCTSLWKSERYRLELLSFFVGNLFEIKRILLVNRCMFSLFRLLWSKHLSHKVTYRLWDDTACTFIWFKKWESNFRRCGLLLIFGIACINGE